MAYVSNINGYDIKDKEARNQIDNITNNISEINNTLNELNTLNTSVNTNTQNITDLSNDNETNKTDIQTLNDTLKTTNTNVQNLSNELNEKEDLKDKLVVFGDSWADIMYSVWSQDVASKLNLTLVNYAKSGAGFILPEINLIDTQLQEFRDDTIDKTKIKYIILMGGINDYRNGVHINDLGPKVGETITAIRNLCPNAKLLFVSNCEYPYNITQSTYWRDLHNTLTTNNSVSSLNLDGTIGNLLYNVDNYFHLTEVGQKWMGRNIICALTGGELIHFQDKRKFADSNIYVEYYVEKLTNNVFNINLKATPLVANTSYSLTVSSNLPELSFGTDIQTTLAGIVSVDFNNVISSITSRTIAIASKTNLTVGSTYEFNYMVTL